MIFYFTGTGNSLYVAKNLATYNDTELISISSELSNSKEFYNYTLKSNEVVGFVFPVYAWGPPKMVLDFINKLKLSSYNANYIFTVVTCGANIGNTIKLLDEHISCRGLLLKSGFSIIMPTNYIIGGNIDKDEVQEKKISEASETLKHINEIIKRRKEDIFEINKGYLPGILTSVVNPLFNKYISNTKKFHVNDDCTGCGICKSVCNCQTISITEKPIWGEMCVQCLACINLCPVKAISYGKNTKNKGRYKNPYISVDELKILPNDI